MAEISVSFFGSLCDCFPSVWDGGDSIHLLVPAPLGMSSTVPPRAWMLWYFCGSCQPRPCVAVGEDAPLPGAQLTLYSASASFQESISTESSQISSWLAASGSILAGSMSDCQMSRGGVAGLKIFRSPSSKTGCLALNSSAWSMCFSASQLLSTSKPRHASSR